jgi:hypothetical protein
VGQFYIFTELKRDYKTGYQSCRSALARDLYNALRPDTRAGLFAVKRASDLETQLLQAQKSPQ